MKTKTDAKYGLRLISNRCNPYLSQQAKPKRVAKGVSVEPTKEQADSENQEDINQTLGTSEAELVKRGKEYGLTPEQSEALSLYL